MSDLPYENTDNPAEVAQYLMALVQGDNGATTGIPADNVMYGDQQLIPRTPFVCVETGPMRSELAGTAYMLQNDMTVYLMVYHVNLRDPDGEQMTRKECDQMAYDLRTLLHSDKTMGGLVIHGHVTNMDPGYAQRQNKLLKMTRISWSGLSKKMI